MTAFPVTIVQDKIDDLHRRLDSVRWPEAATVSANAGDWSQGVRLDWMQDFVADWRTHDFLPCLDRINALGSFVAEVDGLNIHYLHIGHGSGKPPIILTHGWPGGIIEFLDVVDALAEHHSLIIPSLPGYGFSERPARTGWTLERIADAWASLMGGLGYDRYTAQGGDWGAEVSALLAQRHADHCIGAHINLISAKPPKSVLTHPTDAEARALARAKHMGQMEMAYFRQQASRPQTLGYGLADSPVFQAAWICEKFHSWTDNGDVAPDAAIDRGRLLDMVSLYWFTNTGASSARLYWESGYASGRTQIEAPICASLYPKELQTPSRRWAETRYRQIIRWEDLPRGGHFATMEVPELFIPGVLESAQTLWQNAAN